LRFTLRNKKWYACEFIGDEFDRDKCSYSPIRIIDIKPHRNGNRLITLKFFHANYPQGVQTKEYVLRTIERGKHFLLSKSIYHNPCRFLQIYEMDEDWLKRHFPHKDFDRLDSEVW